MSGPEAIAFLKAKDQEKKKSSRLKFEALKSKFSPDIDRNDVYNSLEEGTGNDEETMMKIKALRREMNSMDIRDNDSITSMKNHDLNGDFDAVTPRWARSWIANTPRRLSSRSTAATSNSFTPRTNGSNGQLTHRKTGLLSPVKTQDSSPRTQLKSVENRHESPPELTEKQPSLIPNAGGRGDGDADADGHLEQGCWDASSLPPILKQSTYIEEEERFHHSQQQRNIRVITSATSHTEDCSSNCESSNDPPSIASSYEEESYAAIKEGDRIIDETRRKIQQDQNEIGRRKSILYEWQDTIIQMSDKLQDSLLSKDKAKETEWTDVFNRFKVNDALSSSESYDRHLIRNRHYSSPVDTRWDDEANLSDDDGDKTLEVIGNVLLTTAESLANNALDIGSKLSKGLEGLWSSVEEVTHRMSHVPEPMNIYDHEVHDPTANQLKQMLSGHQEHEKRAIIPSHCYNLEDDSDDDDDDELEDAIDGRWFNESHINQTTTTSYKPDPITYNFSDSCSDDDNNIVVESTKSSTTISTTTTTTAVAGSIVHSNSSNSVSLANMSPTTAAAAARPSTAAVSASGANNSINTNEHLFTRSPYNRMDNDSFSYDPLSNEFWASFLQKISESKKTNDSGAVYWGQRLIDSNTSNKYLKDSNTTTTTTTTIHQNNDSDFTENNSRKQGDDDLWEYMEEERKESHQKNYNNNVELKSRIYPSEDDQQQGSINQSVSIATTTTKVDPRRPIEEGKTSGVKFFHFEDDTRDHHGSKGIRSGGHIISDDDDAFYPMSGWTTTSPEAKDDDSVENSLLIKACIKLDTPPYGGSKHIITVSVKDKTLDIACEFCEQYRLANRTYHALACFLLYLEEDADSYPVTIECSLSDIVRCFEVKEVPNVLEEVIEDENEDDDF